MIVDASALVAIFKGEPTAGSVSAALAAASTLLMPSITLTEVALIGLKSGQTVLSTSTKVAELGIVIVPVEEGLALLSAEARHKYPIRFGDAFVYALAKERGLPVLTLDAEFAKTDALLVPLTP